LHHLRKLRMDKPGGHTPGLFYHMYVLVSGIERLAKMGWCGVTFSIAYLAHLAIKGRRFSSWLPRIYLRDVALPTTWAMEI